MTRFDGLLIVALVVEAGVGAVLFLRRETPSPSPPVPELAESHPAGRDFREMAANCRLIEDWRQLAETYMAHGFDAEADACYEWVVSVRPLDPDALFESAFLLSRMGRLKESNRRFTDALDAGHSNPAECWYFIGRNHLRAGNPDQAAAAFAPAKELTAAQFELARIRFRAGDARGALALLRPVLAAEPNAIGPNLLAYQCYLHLAEPSRAAAFSEKAADTTHRVFTPFHTQWIRLHKAAARAGFRKNVEQAEAWIREKRFDLAEAAIVASIRMQWNEPAADMLAGLATRRGDHRQAVKLLREIVDRRGPSCRRFERLARSYADMRDWKRAIDTLRLALQTRSREDLRSVYGKLAEWSARIGRDADARRDADRQLLSAGQVAFWKADWKLAEASLSEATVRMPDSAEAWFFLAETRRRLNQTEQARSAYERCRSLDPRHGGARRGLKILDAGI